MKPKNYIIFGAVLVLAMAKNGFAETGADFCASCHELEYEEWRTSKHAQAFSGAFHDYWVENGSSQECLACHTTGYDNQSGKYASEGVSCESCHGAFNPDHPDKAKMFLPVDAETCKQCHQNTYHEWKLSAHGQKNIRCFDCHQVHKQGLRQPTTEMHCGSCHAQKLEDFAHATHHFQGLTCMTCHMPIANSAEKIGGAGTPSHSFFVGVETCAACHDQMVHKSHKITSLTREVAALTQKADIVTIEKQQAKIHSLELQLDLQKSRTLRFSIVALAVGLFLGVMTVAFTGGRKSEKQ